MMIVAPDAMVVNDVYFRGGRAASERLSAARIGERVSLFLALEHMCCGWKRKPSPG